MKAQSVVDFMAQPSGNHEPTDPAEPTAELVDADRFWLLVGTWGAHVEHVPSMGRMYALVGGRWYATDELDVVA